MRRTSNDSTTLLENVLPIMEIEYISQRDAKTYQWSALRDNVFIVTLVKCGMEVITAPVLVERTKSCGLNSDAAASAKITLHLTRPCVINFTIIHF